MPAIICILIPLTLRPGSNLVFQLNYLSLLLISICIFSSSAESPTYVIAVTGVAIWYSVLNNTATLSDKILLALVIIFTSFSQTDFFPVYVKTKWMQPYSLKALPCFMVWLKIISDLLFRKPISKLKLSPA